MALQRWVVFRSLVLFLFGGSLLFGVLFGILFIIRFLGRATTTTAFDILFVVQNLLLGPFMHGGTVLFVGKVQRCHGLEDGKATRFTLGHGGLFIVNFLYTPVRDTHIFAQIIQRLVVQGIFGRVLEPHILGGIVEISEMKGRVLLMHGGSYIGLSTSTQLTHIGTGIQRILLILNVFFLFSILTRPTGLSINAVFFVTRSQAIVRITANTLYASTDHHVGMDILFGTTDTLGGSFVHLTIPKDLDSIVQTMMQVIFHFG
mmetsp:Transcript_16570/g.31494  ORF Transcript_16570/g.31494 Transcript_16570/m.31494 type:complete len:260 (+) Transcript_16570:93-872(+)